MPDVSASEPENYVCAVILTDGVIHRGTVIVRWDRVTVDAAPDLFQVPVNKVHQIVSEASQPILLAEPTLLRQAPDQSSTPIMRIAAGQPLTILPATASAPEGWVAVRAYHDAEGWLRQERLTSRVTLQPLPPQTLLVWPVHYATRQDLIRNMGFEPPIAPEVWEPLPESRPASETPFETW